MKLMFGPPLFHLILYCATQAVGVIITSDPDTAGGVIQAELDRIVSLDCQPSSELQADEELVWLRNDAVISLKEGNNKDHSRVCVKPIYEDNGATFTCHLSKNATDSASVTLNVTYHPQHPGPEDVTVEEEAELLLQCDTRANPPLLSVSWTLNGTNVDLVASDLTVMNDGFTSKLSAGRVERSLHEGTYQCVTNSPIYGAHARLFDVTVTDKTIKFPLMPMIAGLVVVCLTAILAVVSRWKKIARCCK